MISFKIIIILQIIDVVDCSGSGDVAMSITKVENGILTGCTGRKFLVPKGWNEIRIGSKRAFELFPGGLVIELCNLIKLITI